MFRIRTIGAIVAVVTLGLSVTACTHEVPTSTDTLQWTPNEPTPAEDPCYAPEQSDATESKGSVRSPIETDPSGATAEDLFNYLKSPERKALYDGLAQEAGPALADLLLNGDFYPRVQRYDGMKQLVGDSYAGWGYLIVYPEGNTIAGTERTILASVKVWWNGDGTIDTSKPFTDMAISSWENPRENVVTINAMPSMPDDLWSASRTVGCFTTTTFGIYSTIDAEGWGGLGLQSNGWYLPTTLEDLKQFDNEAIAQLEANLASWVDNLSK